MHRRPPDPTRLDPPFPSTALFRSALRRDARVGKPQPSGRRPRWPEDVDRDAAARIPVTADTQPAGPHLVEQAAADADGAILVKARMVAERAEEELEALRFDDRFAGGVIDDEMREIGLAGHRAERRELGRGEADEIKLARARIGHIVENGRFGSGRQFARLAEMFRRERRRGGIGHGKALVRSAADVIRAGAPESPAARFSANSAARATYG